MKSALESCSQKVNPELNNDLISLFSGIGQQKIPPFMKLLGGAAEIFKMCKLIYHQISPYNYKVLPCC